MRYDHFIRKTTAERFPTRIVGLSADSEVDIGKSTTNCQRERLVRWAATRVHLTAGEPTGRYVHDGRDQDSFWVGIWKALAAGGTTWIISHACSRVWGLMGLWELIETGIVSLGGYDGGTSDRNGVPIQVPTVPVGDGRPDVARNGSNNTTMPAVQRTGAAVDAAHERARAVPSAKKGVAILEDPPTILTVRVNGLSGTLTLLDVRNYGVECYPRDMHVHDRADWLADFVIDMIGALKSQHWGSLKLSAGGQAMSIYKTAFITHAVHCHTHPEALSLEESAYVGGRCECRRLGKIPGVAYHLDYRSLYPSICNDEWLPVALRSYHAGAAPPVSWLDDSEHLYIGDVTVQTSEPAYPYRRRYDTIYPVGRWRVSLAGPELRDAETRGRIVAWHNFAVYDSAPALRRYAVDLYSMLAVKRRHGSPELIAWLKRLLVCLPGKMGQRGNSWEPYPDGNPPAPWCEWIEADDEGECTRCRSLGWQCQRECKIPWADDSVPAIAAWITSAGRMRLLNAIRSAGWDHVYYYDTDSIICDQTGYDGLVNGKLVGVNEFGRLRVIESCADLEIHGIKHYRINGRLVCSGLPKGVTEQGPDDTCYWYREWLKKAVTCGHRPYVQRVLRNYARDGVYRHGEVDRCGKVRPLTVNE